MQGVSLALQCLSFDFVGTCLDDSSEDLGTIQVRPHRSLLGWQAALKAAQGSVLQIYSGEDIIMLRAETSTPCNLQKREGGHNDT